MTINVSVIGGGFVGGATKLLNSEQVNCIVYDLDPAKCFPLGTTFNDVLSTEAVFIAVPTPFTTKEEDYGKCNTSIVSSVIKQLLNANYNGYIIVRSTVPVGFCESIQSRQVHFMPEFLTERNWAQDFINCKLWILGISSLVSEEEASILKEWYQTMIKHSAVNYKKCSFVSTKEGEMIKYFRNCFLAVKVSFCNEMYRFAEAHNMNYENIRKLACEDDRIGHSHSIVPGPKDCSGGGGYGIGGACLPKDISSLEYQFSLKNVRSDTISAAIKRNNEVDRPEKDWLKYAN